MSKLQDLLAAAGNAAMWRQRLGAADAPETSLSDAAVMAAEEGIDGAVRLADASLEESLNAIRVFARG